MGIIKINGMSCQHCAASVKEAMEKVPGIANVVVDLEKKQASFDGEPELSAIREAITRIGFETV
ncbi:MAG: mercury transporter [Proteobacteria bacterium]|nr:MAG: mercury transporter [Pseudomonadota bacterium]